MLVVVAVVVVVCRTCAACTVGSTGSILFALDGFGYLLISHFGVSRVAELTGRKGRLVRDERGKTALFYATSHGHRAVVEALEAVADAEERRVADEKLRRALRDLGAQVSPFITTKIPTEFEDDDTVAPWADFTPENQAAKLAELEAFNSRIPAPDASAMPPPPQTPPRRRGPPPPGALTPVPAWVVA